MIASMLKLNQRDCLTLRCFDAYSVHRIVYSLFPRASESDQRDFLFVDKGEREHCRYILILSKRKPVHCGAGEIISKPVPQAFLMREQYLFEVVMNPVRRCGTSKMAVPIKGCELLKSWFFEKAVDFGFTAKSETLQVFDTGVVSFDRSKETGRFTQTHNKATFKGELHVIDRELFMKSFKEGIGRAKGFGFGLLQIVPLIN